MHFFIRCKDKAGKVDLRIATRPKHVEYLKRFEANILAAGPTLTDDGQTPTGSVLLMEFPDMKAAEAFAAGDPYAVAGLFERVIIAPWKKVFPAA